MAQLRNPRILRTGRLSSDPSLSPPAHMVSAQDMDAEFTHGKDGVGQREGCPKVIGVLRGGRRVRPGGQEAFYTRWHHPSHCFGGLEVERQDLGGTHGADRYAAEIKAGPCLPGGCVQEHGTGRHAGSQQMPAQLPCRKLLRMCFPDLAHICQNENKEQEMTGFSTARSPAATT